MPDDILGFTHRFVPAAGDDPRTLLLLHGTGGDENDLLPLARTLAPGAAVVSPRGKVLEHGMPRFFRRLAQGVFDVEDLKARAVELAEFVREAEKAYGRPAGRTFAVGYSNGANVAAAAMLLRPRVLAGAVLLRAMVPLRPDETPDLGGAPVLILAGRGDPYSHGATGAEPLAALLREAKADVDLRWMPAGHELSQADLAEAAAWLRAHE